jgi:hypothetical protein
MSDPLRDVGIVQHVFTFLPGSWLFLSAVCREWNGIYAKLADHQVWSSSLYSKRSPVTFGAKTTLCSAALASPASARLACECGLQIRNYDRLQLIAGQYASVQTLHTLRELGMPFGEILISSVALSDRLDILQRLLVKQRL